MTAEEFMLLCIRYHCKNSSVVTIVIHYIIQQLKTKTDPTFHRGTH